MKDFSRRQFLKTAGVATAGAVLTGSAANAASKAGAFNPVQTELEAARADGQKVRLACIGAANQAASDIGQFDRSGLCEITCICDVDIKSRGCQQTIAKYPKAKVFQDFRKMFDEAHNDFDAVLVAIPDFAHFPAAMLAVSYGKHVYVEKPMTRTFNEAELLCDIANRHPEVATQVGNQGHSGENYFQFKAWMEAGIINDCRKITAHFNNWRRWYPYDPAITRFPEAEPIPEGMDWDTWLTTAKYHDFNEKYHPGNWRGWYDFGMGAVGDWGAHLIDTPHQFLHLGVPYEIDPIHVVNHNDFFFPFETTVRYKFAARGNMPECEVTWYDGEKNIPPLPDGYWDTATNADNDIPAITVNGQTVDPRSLGGANGQRPPQGQGGQRPPQGQGGQRPPQGQGGQRPAAAAAPAAQGAQVPQPGTELYCKGPDGKDLIIKRGSHAAASQIIGAARAKELEKYMPVVPESPSNHYENFLLAAMGREKTRSSFQVFAPMSQMFALGTIAMRLNRKIIFDNVTKTCVGDRFATALLCDQPPRKGWEEFYKL
ncbi:MAG: Gfo/Idh/MocA family oxidoreductase [Bacteroidales bacterium]|nr:Gfo/Idh/MocA family oxidoreductase [Bacteroidales bacterium]